MYFMFQARDKKDAGDLRLETREAHLIWIKALGDKIHHAGPLLDEGQMIGSLLILEGESRDDIQALLNEDPYFKVGLFATTELLEWKWVIGAP